MELPKYLEPRYKNDIQKSLKDTVTALNCLAHAISENKNGSASEAITKVRGLIKDAAYDACQAAERSYDFLTEIQDANEQLLLKKKTSDYLNELESNLLDLITRLKTSIEMEGGSLDSLKNAESRLQEAKQELVSAQCSYEREKTVTGDDFFVRAVGTFLEAKQKLVSAQCSYEREKTVTDDGFVVTVAGVLQESKQKLASAQCSYEREKTVTDDDFVVTVAGVLQESKQKLASAQCSYEREKTVTDDDFVVTVAGVLQESKQKLASAQCSYEREKTVTDDDFVVTVVGALQEAKQKLASAQCSYEREKTVTDDGLVVTVVGALPFIRTMPGILGAIMRNIEQEDLDDAVMTSLEAQQTVNACYDKIMQYSDECSHFKKEIEETNNHISSLERLQQIIKEDLNNMEENLGILAAIQEKIKHCTHFLNILKGRVAVLNITSKNVICWEVVIQNMEEIAKHLLQAHGDTAGKKYRLLYQPEIMNMIQEINQLVLE
ncbi:uncharacterized protein LOC122815147 [Protopterus annectens]|uniref:uncharacterized protein LOC122815147 n=1 Tax=Protopterus annectens TaxID=7888 RepID=UPI001CFB7AC5|nr:uncharacterized protein LOC122815147 [Protopterus annectens]